MLPGCGNGAYLYALDNVIVPALKMYKPDVILVASDKLNLYYGSSVR